MNATGDANIETSIDLYTKFQFENEKALWGQFLNIFKDQYNTRNKKKPF